MKYAVIGKHDAGGVQRALLELQCGNGCTIPLRQGEPRMGASKVWGWDGKEQSPTVTPSIDCTKCGFHKTLNGGAWS